jgi:hypothetical protein
MIYGMQGHGGRGKSRLSNGKTAIAILLGALACIAGCGGGSGGSPSSSGGNPPPVAPKILSFRAPDTYTDNTPLVPGPDTLDPFEIHVNETGDFPPDNPPRAYVYIQQSGQMDYTYDLANLAPQLPRGTTLYVRVRAVAAGGGFKSDYSDTASFSFQ